MSQQTSAEPGRVRAVNVDVSVAGTGNTLLLEVPTDGINELAIEVVVTDQDLDAFEVHGRIHPDSDWQVLYDTGFDTPTGLLIGTSGDLTSQGVDTTGWLFINVTSLYAVRVFASAAADSAVVTARANGGAT